MAERYETEHTYSLQEQLDAAYAERMRILNSGAAYTNGRRGMTRSPLDIVNDTIRELRAEIAAQTQVSATNYIRFVRDI